MNRASPSISVVMAVCNGEKYLGHAIDSILSQTYGQFEFIVVDDASDDSTPAILSDYTAQDNRIQVLRNTDNMGLGCSLNRGLAIAKGTYIARQDADDISLPSRLSQQIEFMEQYPTIGLLGTQADLIDASGATMPGQRWRYALDNRALQEQLLKFCAFIHGSVMFRRQCFEMAGGHYDSDMSEDYDLWLRMAEVSEVANLDAVLYLYRVHGSSMSTERGADQPIQAAGKLAEAIKRRCGAAPTEAEWIPAARAYTRAAIVNWLVSRPDRATGLLARAMELSPGYFDLVEDLEDLLIQTATTYMGCDPADVYDSSFLGLFELLPARQRAILDVLVSRFHMRRVFAASQRNEWGEVGRHLPVGLRHDRSWLRNRGVLSIAARAVPHALKRQLKRR